ncbi:MAG: DUF1643 domain-containing protein [Acidobacteria bacterium]|nr:DUF1643 domain-containing protein [Acidobacteriota bacterium]
MPADDSRGKHTPAYRWTLKRDLGDLLAPKEKHVLVGGLNPSTADAERDDPTSRRVIGFARREQATHLTMVNLYAARTTDPKGLKDFNDPVGTANDQAIADAAREADLVIAAWGKPPGKAGKARARQVLEMLRAAATSTGSGRRPAKATPGTRRTCRTAQHEPRSSCMRPSGDQHREDATTVP